MVSLLFVLVSVEGRAAGARENARRARALLGVGVWSRLIRVENTGAHSAYPRTVYAVVFEMGGILWFYTDTDGTQSFSLSYGDLRHEKRDFAPLLRAIDPGFSCYTIVAEPASALPPSSAGDDIPNGCFIESFAALRARIARGEAIERARLLSFYFNFGGARRGHTVLEYETPRGAFAVDATMPGALARPLDRRTADDALAVAHLMRPDLAIDQARWVPTDLPRLGRVADARGTAPTGAATRQRRESSQQE